MSKCNDCHKNIEKTVVEKALHGYATYIDICNECIAKYPLNDIGVRVIIKYQHEDSYRPVRASEFV